MINKVILVGNLGRDPEIRRFENGGIVAKFSVATNESYKDKNGNWQTQTEWHDIACWRGMAERAERELKKGKLVYIEGKITHRKYTDQNNIERYTTEVVANIMRPLEKNTDRNASYADQSGQMDDSGPNHSQELASMPEQTSGSFVQGEEDGDLPF